MAQDTLDQQSTQLTGRQAREAAYYDQYSTNHEVQKVDFAQL